MKKKVLFISGQDNKRVFLASVAHTLVKKKGIKFQHIVGVSSGALIGLLLAIGNYDELESVKPTFIQRIRGLKSRLKTIITKDQFKRYQKAEKTPRAYIILVDINTGYELIIDVKKHEYEVVIDYLITSLTMNHKKINGRNMMNGCLRSHTGSSTWLKKNVSLINECYSIYSHPKDLENITWELRVIPFRRIIEILNLEVSKIEEVKSDIILMNVLKRNEKIFAPYKLYDKKYDALKTWRIGVETVEDEPNLIKEI